MTSLTTQAEFERNGLLLLYDALQAVAETGWEYIVEPHGRILFVRLTARPIRGRLPEPFTTFGRFVLAIEASGFEKLFCTAHNGSGSGGPSLMEYVYLRYQA